MPFCIFCPGWRRYMYVNVPVEPWSERYKKIHFESFSAKTPMDFWLDRNRCKVYWSWRWIKSYTGCWPVFFTSCGPLARKNVKPTSLDVGRPAETSYFFCKVVASARVRAVCRSWCLGQKESSKPKSKLEHEKDKFGNFSKFSRFHMFSSVVGASKTYRS